jgi:hypothetical protein
VVGKTQPFNASQIWLVKNGPYNLEKSLQVFSVCNGAGLLTVNYDSYVRKQMKKLSKFSMDSLSLTCKNAQSHKCSQAPTRCRLMPCASPKQPHREVCQASWPSLSSLSQCSPSQLRQRKIKDGLSPLNSGHTFH